MSNDLNQCNFIGRLGADVETRYMPNGNAVANFRIAVGRKWKDKQSGEVREETQWVRIVAFNRLADICSQYLKKGSQVFVSGSFKERKWQDQQGQDRYTTEIVADQMQMLDGQRNNQGGGQQQQPQQQQAPQQQGGFEDDSIPF